MFLLLSWCFSSIFFFCHPYNFWRIVYSCCNKQTNKNLIPICAHIIRWPIAIICVCVYICVFVTITNTSNKNKNKNAGSSGNATTNRIGTSAQTQSRTIGRSRRAHRFRMLFLHNKGMIQRFWYRHRQRNDFSFFYIYFVCTFDLFNENFAKFLFVCLLCAYWDVFLYIFICTLWMFYILCFECCYLTTYIKLQQVWPDVFILLYLPTAYEPNHYNNCYSMYV